MYSRTNPYSSKIRERVLLNKPGSSKETYHISLEVQGLDFKVGDSVGVFPVNERAIVDAILGVLNATGSEIVLDRAGNQLPLEEFLLKKGNLCKCTSSFLKLLKERGAESELLTELLVVENKAQLMTFLETNHLVDILQKFKPLTLCHQELVSALLPLMPRFYSIASSKAMYPHEIHLTVASLSYQTEGGPRHGVGSHFLCHSATPLETAIPIYVQPSTGFTLPADPDASMIFIGPGTGIAPFRAFLQERTALQHTGRSWLFFGERNRDTDFYYDDYFLALEKQNRLRLDLAFSRDSAEKVYVQHRLWENRASVWDWLQNGAYLFVCGDAEKMAKDVDLTLHRIAQDAGLSEAAARDWLKALRKDRRYLQDVY